MAGPRAGEGRRSVVLVAYRYPPMLGPGSHRAASFAAHLPALGWDPSVVTARGALFHQDPGYRPPPVPTLRTRSPEPSKLLAPLRGRPTGNESGAEMVPELALGPGMDRLRRFVVDYVYVPDAQSMWIPLALTAARRALRAAAAPKVLFSTSVPYSAHVASLLAGRREDVPWVAELRDPWAQLDDRVRRRSPARKRIDARLERWVVQSADALVVTSDMTRASMLAAYPELREDRVHVVRNGYEPAEGAPPPPPADAPLQLVNAGSVPGDASVEPLLRGIDRVARERPGEVRLEVLAPPGRWRQAASGLGEPEWLELRGLVAPDVAQRTVAGASANVLIRPGEHHGQYVASKLLGYLGARRPILGIVSGAGEMAALGRDYGDMRIVADYSEDSVAAAVKELLEEHRRGLLAAPAEGARAVEELTRQAQAARLAQVLESVL